MSESLNTVSDRTKDWLYAELLAQTVRLIGSEALTGVPRRPPSSRAARPSLMPNVNPSGNSPSISHVPTSPMPVTFGINGSMVWLTNRSTYCVGYDRLNAKSITSSKASHVPSPSVSSGRSMASTVLLPHKASISSDHVSSSSSRSSTSGGVLVEFPLSASGMPSPSVSSDAAASCGNASGPAEQPPLAGTSGPSQTPSPSVSAFAGSVPVSPVLL